VKIWDFKSGKLLLDLERLAICAAFSPDGKVLALGGESQIICVDATNGQEVRSYCGPSDGVGRLSFSADGRWLASWHFGVLRGDVSILWGQQPSSVLLPKTGTFASASAFSPDSRRLISADSRSVFVWDTGNGRKLFALEKLNQWN